jgi:hypothetical protein
MAICAGCCWEVRWHVSARRGHARHHTQTSPRWPSTVVHTGSCYPYQRSSLRAHGGQTASRAGCVGAQHQQRSEETSSGQIANEKWLTARGSATMRERQRLYLQYTPHCSSRRKPTVGGDFLRHFVSRQLYKSLCPTDQTCSSTPVLPSAPPLLFMV